MLLRAVLDVQQLGLARTGVNASLAAAEALVAGAAVAYVCGISNCGACSSLDGNTLLCAAAVGAALTVNQDVKGSWCDAFFNQSAAHHPWC
jgi:hypothetical protein